MTISQVGVHALPDYFACSWLGRAHIWYTCGTWAMLRRAGGTILHAASSMLLRKGLFALWLLTPLHFICQMISIIGSNDWRHSPGSHWKDRLSEHFPPISHHSQMIYRQLPATHCRR